MVDGIDLNPLQKPKCCQSNHGASSPTPPNGKPNPSLQQKSIYSSSSYQNLAYPIPASNFIPGIKMVCPLRRSNMMGPVAEKEFVQGKLTVASIQTAPQDLSSYKSSPSILTGRGKEVFSNASLGLEWVGFRIQIGILYRERWSSNQPASIIGSLQLQSTIYQ